MTATHTVGVFATLFDQQGRIGLVRQSYAGCCWTQPGGRLERGEAPEEGLLREIFEETAVRARIIGHIGTYLAPWRDDIVLHFRAEVVSREAWAECSEILDHRFFAPDDLPGPMRRGTWARIQDGLSGASGVFRIVDEEGGRVVQP